jgi:hypothetical protein
MRKAILFATTLSILAAGFAWPVESYAGQQILRDEAFKTGKIRFVPLVTITDEAMGGKALFSWPMDVAEDGQGRIYVSDFKENNIKVFDKAGVYLKTIGRKGQGPGEFQYLFEVEFSHGRLYASENSRITVFDAEGAYLRTMVAEKGRSWQKMRALPDGRFLVEKNLVDYQSPSRKEETLLDLYSAEFAFLKTVYQREVRRYKYFSEPTARSLPIPYAAAFSWDLLPDGRIAVGYPGNYKIEFYDPDKGKIGSFSHASTPVEVTAEDKKVFFAGISYMTQDGGGPPVLHKGASEFTIKNTEFPKFKPPFTRLLVDAQGRIWVRLSEPAVEKKGPRFDVFDRSGRFLGNVIVQDGAFPSRMLPWEGGFWAIKATEDDDFSIVKFGIEVMRRP